MGFDSCRGRRGLVRVLHRENRSQIEEVAQGHADGEVIAEWSVTAYAICSL